MDFSEKSLVIPFVLDIRMRRNEKIHRQLQTRLSEWSYAPNTAMNNLNQTILGTPKYTENIINHGTSPPGCRSAAV